MATETIQNNLIWGTTEHFKVFTRAVTMNSFHITDQESNTSLSTFKMADRTWMIKFLKRKFIMKI